MDYGASEASQCDEGSNLFKESFKYYKRRRPPPDLSNALDARRPEHRHHFHQVHLRSHSVPGASSYAELGTKPLSDWRLLTLADKPGLFIVDNVFTEAGAMQWAHEAVFHYPFDSGNVTNLCALNQRHVFAPVDFVTRLRWTTLGYHYDWNTKEYDESRRHAFPPRLSALCSLLADALHMAPYTAEAAIVNYYTLDSTLSGHVDKSESDVHRPLFSFSFGQSGVLLLGGAVLSQRPVALVLRHGQCVVLSGAQRLAYHGVPAIVADAHFDHTAHVDAPATAHSDHGQRLPHICQYLQQHRLNVSVRQVNRYE